jgi:hypothetical protein
MRQDFALVALMSASHNAPMNFREAQDFCEALTDEAVAVLSKGEHYLLVLLDHGFKEAATA